MSMRIAVMQPYFFPYLGYFQLIAAVDRFVILDDVPLSDQANWVRRNRWLTGGVPEYFTVPLQRWHRGTLIENVNICESRPWRHKMLQGLRYRYAAAAQFASVAALVERTLSLQTEQISELAKASVTEVMQFLGLSTSVVSSAQYGNASMRGAERILDICRLERATQYLNLPGGALLYNASDFEDKRIALKFIDPALPPYKQGNAAAFVPSLSIIDVLMHNSVNQVNAMLSANRILPAGHRKPAVTSLKPLPDQIRLNA
jgi:hypothetical protein